MRNRLAVTAVLASSVAIATAGVGVRAESPAPESATARRGNAYFHLMKARLVAGEGRLSEELSELPDSHNTHC